MIGAALDEYVKVSRHNFGNPQGSHEPARQALRLLDEYRARVAKVLGCDAANVYFTSGATESDNLAVRGSAALGRVACSAVEHKAVLAPVVKESGDVIGVQPGGELDLDDLRKYLKRDGRGLACVSLMAVNNETGVVWPTEILAGMVHLYTGALFHCDAVQAANVMELAPLVASADLLSLSAHKFGGPKGTGILVAKDRSRLVPLVLGGSQERDVRPGTQDLASIGAMTVALEAAQEGAAAKASRLEATQAMLERGLAEKLPEARVTGAFAQRSPGITHLVLPGASSEELLFLLDREGVYASGGAACASGALEPSHVLIAMGMDVALAKGALRFSFLDPLTDDQVAQVVDALSCVYARLTGVNR